MGGQPAAADWEYVVGSDLMLHLLPAGRPRGVHRPAGVAWLPDGAHPAIVDSVGRAGLEDLLVVPAVAWPVEPWRRQCLYSPPCVMGIGERGIGLWVQALPVPGVRVQVPFEEIAAIEQRRDGPCGMLIVTGRAGMLPVRYHADGQAVVDAWTRRLRGRAAAMPAPVPPHPSGRQPYGGADLGSLLLSQSDPIVYAGWRSRVGRGACLLGVTSRELVVVQSLCARRRPWRRTTRTLCVPRGSIEDAVVRSKTVLLRSAGAEVRIVLQSRKVAAAADSWLWWMLSDHGRLGSAGPPRAGRHGDGKRQ
jgi:hypothetical protein